MYSLVTGPCMACQRLFAYNQDHVPSHRVNGVREPICRKCIDGVNSIRIQRGDDPFPIHPDAYEPKEES
jgi:hypothetical protein